MVKTNCRQCGEEFEAERWRKQLYCSRACVYKKQIVDEETRFLEKVEKVSSGCWLWRGSVSRGRPTFRFKRRAGHAAEFSFSHFVEPFNADVFTVVASCKDPMCVNPAHLRLQIASFRLSEEERFWTYVEKGSGCWMWKGAVTSSRYGVFRFKGTNWRAHAVSLYLTKGILQGPLDICHSCDVRLCVNPDHLFLGTRKDNMDDAKRKGRLYWQKQAARDKSKTSGS